MKKFKLLLIIAIFLPGFLANAQTAPRIYLESVPGTVFSQSSFTINVFLDTDSPINALDIKITYPKDRIIFSDADNSGSVIDIWPASPKSNTPGEVSFSGGLFKPFTGNKSLVTKLAFQR